MSHQTPRGLIIFSSLPEFFEREQDGRKPNTVRIMDTGEAVRAFYAKRIHVTCVGESRAFEAPLTDVCDAGEVCGKHLIVFSWDANRVERLGYDKEDAR